MNGGHRAIVWSRVNGISDSPYGEGLHFILPFIDYPIDYDVQIRARNIQSLTGSKDLQMVNITLRVLSRPDRDQLPFIYKRLGKDYDNRVLPSIVNETTKAVVARYNAAELLTKREMVSAEIRDRLVARAADFKIILTDVSITHLSFSAEYTAAVESKQVAQQDAERAKYIVDRALQEKRSIVIKAEGESKSAQLIGDAIKNNPGFVELRKIDAARDIADTVSRGGNKVYLSADGLLMGSLGNVGADKKK